MGALNGQSVQVVEASSSVLSFGDVEIHPSPWSPSGIVGIEHHAAVAARNAFAGGPMAGFSVPLFYRTGGMVCGEELCLEFESLYMSGRRDRHVRHTGRTCF